jgi:hypothetical protein
MSGGSGGAANLSAASGLDTLTMRKPVGAGDQEADENETAALQAVAEEDKDKVSSFAEMKVGLGPESRWQCWRSLLSSEDAVIFCVTLGQSCKGEWHRSCFRVAHSSFPSGRFG